MRASADLDPYLRALAGRLRLDPGTEREVLLELRGHLEERVLELEASGVARQDALELAIQELGHPDNIARGMYSIHSKGSWRDIILATLPHLLLALLLAFHLWSRFVWVAILVVVVTFVSLRAWRAGVPKWTYPWLGYAMAAPTVSCLLALATLGYGAWLFFTTGALPYSLPIFILLAAFGVFSLWIVASMLLWVIRQDWLLASLTALPFPFLTSWLLLLNWQGGLLAPPAGLHESDYGRALVFLALALTTAVYFKTGQRLVKIGVLTATTAVMVVYTTLVPPLGFGLLAAILMTIASVGFLLSPAILERRMGFRRAGHGPDHTEKGVVTHWFVNAG